MRSVPGLYHGMMRIHYLIAYDSSEGIIKHFRVDKMIYIKSNGKGREGRQVLNHLIWLHMPEKCLECMEEKRNGCVLSVITLLQV